MAITIHQPHANHLRLVISAEQLPQNLPLGTGRVKNYGQDQGVLQRVLQNLDKENISIFVKYYEEESNRV